jgi:hypothetical protein
MILKNQKQRRFMESSFKALISNNLVNKVTGIEYFLILLGILFYSDLFIFLTSGENIATLKLSSLADTTKQLTLLNIFQYLVYLTLLYAILSIAFLFIYETGNSLLSKKSNKFISNNLSELKNVSIAQNHNVGYEYYLKQLAEVSTIKLQKRIIFVNIVLVLTDFVVSFMYPDKIHLLNVLSFHDGTFDSALVKFVDIILMGLLVALFVFVKHIPTHENNVIVDEELLTHINKKEWLNEISLGLVNKDDLLTNLQVILIDRIIFSNNISFEKIQSDKKLKEALEYCEHFQLVYYHQSDKKIILTPKGEYFEKYVLDIDPFKKPE